MPIDELLNLLKDEEWHSVYEIDEKMPIQTKSLLELINFLVEFDFIDAWTGEEGEITKIKIMPDVKEFLNKLEKLEK